MDKKRIDDEEVEITEKKTAMLSCRLRPDLLRRLRLDAEVNYRSMAAQLTMILDQHYASKDGDAGPACRDGRMPGH